MSANFTAVIGVACYFPAVGKIGMACYFTAGGGGDRGGLLPRGGGHSHISPVQVCAAVKTPLF